MAGADQIDAGEGHPLPVTLLTGFLGSGKTTLLNRLLTCPEFAGSAVIVNEIGDVGLDHEMVTQVADNIVLLQSGCLCCAIRGDLLETLHDLLERKFSDQMAFGRVVIETSGMADPVPVLHTLMADELLAELCRIDRVVVTVDAHAGVAGLQANPEALSQISVADCVVLTKLDLAEAADVEPLAERITQMNPLALVVGAQDLPQTAALLAAPLGERGEARLAELERRMAQAADAPPHGEGVVSVSLILDQPLSPTTLEVWRQELTARQGSALLRAKGLLNVQGHPGPVLLHAVQHLLHPFDYMDEWPSLDHRTRLVLIARDADPAPLHALAGFLRDVAQTGGLAVLAPLAR